MDLGLHLEAISGPFWSHAGTLWAKVATQIPKKGLLREVQNQDPQNVDLGISWEGVRRVHSCTIAQFSLFRPDPLWLHFGSHFGIDLEAQIATILLLCRRWSSIDRLLGFLFDVHSQQGSSRGLATLEALSTRGGGVEAKCGFWSPRGRTTGGARRAHRDPTRLMTPNGVGGYVGHTRNMARRVMVGGLNPRPSKLN